MLCLVSKIRDLKVHRLSTDYQKLIIVLCFLSVRDVRFGLYSEATEILGAGRCIVFWGRGAGVRHMCGGGRGGGLVWACPRAMKTKCALCQQELSLSHSGLVGKLFACTLNLFGLWKK